MSDEQTFYTCDKFELGECEGPRLCEHPINCVMEYIPRRSDWTWCGNSLYPISKCENSIGPPGDQHWHRSCSETETYFTRITVWEVPYNPRSKIKGQLSFPFIANKRRNRFAR